MIDSEPIALVAWRAAFGELGHEAPDQLFLPLIGRNSRDSYSLLRAALGEEFPLDNVVSRLRFHSDAHISAHGIPLKSGLQELLDFLDSTHLSRAVATSTHNQRAWEKLRITGIASRFETLVGGDEVENGKPAPDIFLAAARRLGVSPERCLVLEDSEAGVQGAAAAGMTPIMVPDLVQPGPASMTRAYAVLPSLLAVRALLSPSP